MPAALESAMQRCIISTSVAVTTERSMARDAQTLCAGNNRESPPQQADRETTAGPPGSARPSAFGHRHSIPVVDEIDTN
jgi:hypothetical protein